MYCVLSMWGKIMVPMYRLWLHGLYGIHGPQKAVKLNHLPMHSPTHSLTSTVGELRSTLCTKTPLHARSGSYMKQMPLEHLSYIKRMPLPQEHLSYINETSCSTSQGSTLSFLAGCPKSHFLGWYRNLFLYWYSKLDNPGCQLNLPEGQIRLDLTRGRPLV